MNFKQIPSAWGKPPTADRLLRKTLSLSQHPRRPAVENRTLLALVRMTSRVKPGLPGAGTEGNSSWAGAGFEALCRAAAGGGTVRLRHRETQRFKVTADWSISITSLDRGVLMDEFDDIIKEVLIESNENLAQLDKEFVELEQRPDDQELLSSIFRTIQPSREPAALRVFRRWSRLLTVPRTC